MSSIRSCGLVLVALLQLVPAAQGTEQSVAVEGRVICHGKSYAGAKLYLMEKDLMDPDDKYDETVSNYSGFFQLEGWENEILDIDPYMKVIHTCMADKARRPCTRTFTMDIPSEAVHQDRIIRNKFKFNTIELADARPDETEECY